MKFTMTMKDPDGAYDSIQETVKSSVKPLGLSKAESEAVVEVRVAELNKFCGRWLHFGEYLDVEFDTDAGTATVLVAR